jgi:hypothetical protein
MCKYARAPEVEVIHEINLLAFSLNFLKTMTNGFLIYLAVKLAVGWSDTADLYDFGVTYIPTERFQGRPRN